MLKIQNFLGSSHQNIMDTTNYRFSNKFNLFCPCLSFLYFFLLLVPRETLLQMGLYHIFGLLYLSPVLYHTCPRGE
jgi:hypothetical protein